MEVLVNKNLKNILTLLEESGTRTQRNKLQKIVFILKYMNFPFEEKFKYNYYGPFSTDLELEIDELIDRNLLSETDVNSYICVVDGNTEIKYEKTNFSSKQKELIKFLSNKKFEDLETTSTIYYLENSGVKDHNIIRKKIKTLKPHLDPYIESSFKLHEKINDICYSN